MSVSTTSSGVSLSGLASGIDWQSIVTQLVAAERAPETQLRTQQTTILQKNSAYQAIGAQLTSLNNAATTLSDPNFFTSRTATSTATSVATAAAAEGTALGNYTFNISQLATSAVQQGTTAAGKALSATNDVSNVVLGTAGFANPVTAGTFTVNGKTITIATTDTLQSVFNQINSATGGAVTGSYDSTSDSISLTSASPIVLGSATDTSNFLQSAKLYNNGTNTVTSTSALGGVNLTGAMSNSNLSTTISDGGSGAGAFQINGVTINFNASSDSINDVLTRINNSSAGVTATYDPINNRFALTNRSTGDVGISLNDVTGNFLAATGLSGGTLQRGKNLQYSINNGGTITNQSNTITASSSGITGLTVTALNTGSTLVSIGADTTKISQAISTFVSSYNAAQNFIHSQTASTTDSTGKVTAGLLTGDLDAGNIESQLRSLTSGASLSGSSTIQNLSNIGISSNGQDNTITISDATALSNALANNLDAVKQLFTDSTNGIAAQVKNYIGSLTGDNGTITTKEADFNNQSKDIDKTIATMELKINDDQARLTQEFVNMETAQANSKSQQTYLTQYFSSSSSSSG